jgi:hypothetical protein
MKKDDTIRNYVAKYAYLLNKAKVFTDKKKHYSRKKFKKEDLE